MYHFIALILLLAFDHIDTVSAATNASPAGATNSSFTTAKTSSLRVNTFSVNR